MFTDKKERADQPVLDHIRKDFIALRDSMTVNDVLVYLRKQKIGHEIIYFYVLNGSDQLSGVLPVRKLLASAPEERLSQIMISPVITIPDKALFIDACEMFTKHKHLAYPVVDDDKHILGVIDISIFSDGSLDLNQKERLDEIFSSIGFRIANTRNNAISTLFKIRFPWLIATLISGSICAFLTGAFSMTIEKSITIVFFISLVLGLSESVSIQTMSITLYALRHEKLSGGWFAKAIAKEFSMALLLGLGCGLLSGGIVWLWKSHAVSSIAIGVSIFASMIAACLFGLIVPSIVHALKLDPKIASGPITLAVTDISTVLLYFTLARMIIG